MIRSVEATYLFLIITSVCECLYNCFINNIIVLITQSHLYAALLNGSICIPLRQPHPSPKLKCSSLLYLTTAVLNDCYSEVMAYITLAYSVFMMCMDVKVTPTNAGYSLQLPCKNIELIQPVIQYRVYITPLVINSLRGGDTHIHTCKMIYFVILKLS